MVRPRCVLFVVLHCMLTVESYVDQTVVIFTSTHNNVLCVQSTYCNHLYRARWFAVTRWRLMNPNLYGQTHTGHNNCDGKVHSQKQSGADMKMACAPPFNHEHSCNLASAWARGGYLIRHTHCTCWWDTHTVRLWDEIYFSWIMKNSEENMFYLEMKDLEQSW